MPSERKFRVQHVASKPRGWKVRMVESGDHEVRIAFPPGRREKGSGHVVEILHPQHENPSYCPSASRMRNPAELVLMGLNNPMRRRRNQLPALAEDVIGSAGGEIAAQDLTRRSRRRNAGGKHFAIRWHTGNISNAYPTQAEAESILRRFHGAGEVIRVNPIPLRGERYRNPVDTADAEEAKRIRSGFVDREARGYSVYDEPHIPAGDYALIGPLLSLAVKPAIGGEVQQIEFHPRPIAISDTSRTQIYFAKRAGLSVQELRRFAAQDSGVVRLGECREIVYLAAKYHPEVGSSAAGKEVEWQHQFGERSGEKPDLFYDTHHERLLLRGGAYRVEDAGIVN